MKFYIENELLESGHIQTVLLRPKPLFSLLHWSKASFKNHLVKREAKSTSKAVVCLCLMIYMKMKTEPIESGRGF